MKLDLSPISLKTILKSSSPLGWSNYHLGLQAPLCLSTNWGLWGLVWKSPPSEVQPSPWAMRQMPNRHLGFCDLFSHAASIGSSLRSSTTSRSSALSPVSTCRIYEGQSFKDASEWSLSIWVKMIYCWIRALVLMDEAISKLPWRCLLEMDPWITLEEILDILEYLPT